MVLRRKAWFFALGFGIVVAAAGFFPYPVTGLVQRLGQGLVEKDADWKVVVGKARWVPWSGLDIFDLRIQNDRRGQIRMAYVRIVPEPLSLLHGHLMTRLIISSGSGTTGGSACLRLRGDRVELERLALDGGTFNFYSYGEGS